MNKKSSFIVTIIGAMVLLIISATFIVAKVSTQLVNEKWKDYDECGWL